MLTDFDTAAPEQSNLPPTQIDTDDPNAYAALQQYLRTYQHALLEAAEENAKRVEKKSGPAEIETSTPTFPLEVTTIASTNDVRFQLKFEIEQWWNKQIELVG